MGARLIIALNKGALDSFTMPDEWRERRNAKRPTLGSPGDWLAWNAANPGKPKDERGRWTDSPMDQRAQKRGLFKVDEGIFVDPKDFGRSDPWFRNEYGHGIGDMRTDEEHAAAMARVRAENAEYAAEKLENDVARGARGAFERFWRRPISAQGYGDEAMYIGRGRFSVTEKAVLRIDLAKRRGPVGKLKGAGDGGETVASWNAANPTHPRGADGRFRDAFNSALSIRGDSIEAEAGRRKGVADALRGLVAEHGGAKTKLGKALLDMVGPGESVSVPNLTPDAKLESAKRPRIKLGSEEKVKRLNELSDLGKPTADDAAEFDKVLSTMTVAEMKAWLASKNRVVHNPGKKDAFRAAITGSIIGSKRDSNVILSGKWNASIGPSEEQFKGAETAARLRSALASIQANGLTEANEADFRKHLAEMTPAELDAFRKEHDLPGNNPLAIKASALKIFVEGRKRTQAVMHVEELADRHLAPSRGIQDMIENPQSGDREKLRAELSKLTLSQLSSLARDNNVRLLGAAKPQKIDNFIESTVGNKLNSQAIRSGAHHDVGETAFGQQVAKTERFPGDKHGGDAKFMADLEQARKDYPEIGRYVEGPAALKKIVAEKQAEGIARQLTGATPEDRKQILSMVADNRLEAVAHASGVPVRKEWSGQVLRDHIARHLEAFAMPKDAAPLRTPSKRIPPDAALNSMSVKALRDLYQELTGIELKPSSARLKRDVIASIKHDVGQGDFLRRESEAWDATVTRVDAENVRRAAADDADFAKFQAERAEASLKEAADAEAGKKYLQNLGLGKAQAHQLAKDLDVPVAANASIDSVLNSIVDIKVKWRLASKAIEGTSSKESKPAGNSFPRSNVKWDWEKIKEDNMTMHGDSASMELAQALQRAGREDDASYVADMRFRTSNTRGERSSDDLERMVGDLKAMMAREQDPGLRARYQRALEDIDAPARPAPDLPDSTPPILRRIIEDLNKIPNARRTGHFAGTHKDISVVERLARVIRKVDEGDRDTYRTWEMQMRDALHSLHESVDGAMRMWTLAELLSDPEIRTWVRSRRPGS